MIVSSHSFTFDLSALSLLNLMKIKNPFPVEQGFAVSINRLWLLHSQIMTALTAKARNFTTDIGSNKDTLNKG